MKTYEILVYSLTNVRDTHIERYSEQEYKNWVENNPIFVPNGYAWKVTAIF